MQDSPNENSPILFACGCIKLTKSIIGMSYLRHQSLRKANKICPRCLNEAEKEVKRLQLTFDGLFDELKRTS